MGFLDSIVHDAVDTANKTQKGFSDMTPEEFFTYVRDNHIYDDVGDARLYLQTAKQIPADELNQRLFNWGLGNREIGGRDPHDIVYDCLDRCKSSGIKDMSDFVDLIDEKVGGSNLRYTGREMMNWVARESGDASCRYSADDARLSSDSANHFFDDINRSGSVSVLNSHRLFEAVYGSKGMTDLATFKDDYSTSDQTYSTHLMDWLETRTGEKGLSQHWQDTCSHQTGRYGYTDEEIANRFTHYADLFERAGCSPESIKDHMIDALDSGISDSNDMRHGSSVLDRVVRPALNKWYDSKTIDPTKARTYASVPYETYTPERTARAQQETLDRRLKALAGILPSEDNNRTHGLEAGQ